jgi:RNA polymerase-binding transcription factor DksA
MPKKGELSKTARASLANREEINHLTSRICEKCGEQIMLKDLQPVKVMGQGMKYYHKSHYNVQ